MLRKTVLDNGVRVVSEQVPHVRTVSVGIWVDVGARDEHDLTSGCSHFVEHMLFKGTSLRSAGRIAMEFDVLGGTANAFTGKDVTCYHATVLDDQLPRLLELFADCFRNSLFDPEEVEREQQVILQEISMVEDTPEEQIHDLFEKLLWGHHPLGNTVLGAVEVVSRMDRQKLLDHLRNFYTPDRIVIAAAGNVEHDAFVGLLDMLFSPLCVVHPLFRSERKAPTELALEQKVLAKPLEQAHVALGTYGLDVHSPDRYALMLLNIMLGGNMSSRLFQEIREKRGLAYSVHSYLDSYQDGGYIGIYLGVHPANINCTLDLVETEIVRFCQAPVTAEELTNARVYARAGLLLAAESMEMRMTRLGRNELYFGRDVSFDEVLRGLEKVTGDAVCRLACHLFGKGMSTVVVGPLAAHEVDRHFPAGFPRTRR
ncbi:MAG: M16 family metallopeptidase [Thermodesulfobacteriota bacterium]